MDKCSKHDEVMARTFDALTEIKLKVENVDTKMDGIIEFKDMVHKVIYGNGGPGMKGTVEAVSKHLNLQWGVLIVLITAIVTGAVLHFVGG